MDDICICEDCGRELVMCDWDMESTRCDTCQRKHVSHEWIEAMEAEVARLADAHGWYVSDARHARESRSRYLTIRREIDEETGDFQELVVRVSDHGSCYCREDVSLAQHPGGDDHTIAQLVARLSAPRA